jgi:hypothetical protein
MQFSCAFQCHVYVKCKKWYAKLSIVLGDNDAVTLVTTSAYVVTTSAYVVTTSAYVVSSMAMCCIHKQDVKKCPCEAPGDQVH